MCARPYYRPRIDLADHLFSPLMKYVYERLSGEACQINRVLGVRVSARLSDSKHMAAASSTTH